MRHSIRTRLTVYLIGLAVVPLVIVGAALAWQAFQGQQRQALDNQQQVVERVSVEIASFINGLEDTLQFAIDVQEIAEQDSAAQERIMRELLAFEAFFDDLMLLDGNGQEVARVARNRAYEEEDLGSRADAPAFTQAAEGETYYSSVQYDLMTGEPLMTIAVPYIDQDDSLDGVLVAEARVKTVWDVLEEIAADDDIDNLYVVDDDGRVIAHRNPTVVLSETSFDVPGTNGIHTGLEGNDVVLSSTQQAFGGETLTVVTETAVSQVQQPAVNTLVIVAVVMASVVLLAVALALLAVRQIVRPIQSLATASRAMTEGDLDQRVDVARHDEIGDLAEAFNTMAGRLKTTLEGLEARVANRTRDLQIASDVSRQITTVLDFDDLMRRVATETARGYDLDAVFVFLPSEDGNRMVRRVGADSAGNLLNPESLSKISVGDEHSVVARAARNRTVVNVGDVAGSDLVLPGTTPHGSELAAPMMLGEQLLGVFDLQSRETNYFSDDEVRVFTTLAEQIAVAVRNAQLFEETEQAKAEAERANTVKSQFLASVSHELRTPLNAILNFTQFVSSGMLGEVNDEQVEMLDKTVSSGEHLLSLINDVLDISKIEADSLELFIEDDVDVNQALQMVIATGETMVQDSSVDFLVEIDDDLPHIRGDRQRIGQIMLNLVSNACKFTEEGHVKLRVTQRDDNVQMSVSDTGPGIEPDERERVFQSFHQSKSGLRQGSGTGLGLAISRRLAEAHGGSLQLESEPGQGSTFIVTLPVQGEINAKTTTAAEA